MSLLTIILIAVILSVDAFSVCIGIGMCNLRKRIVIIIALTVGIFHIFMPLLGIFLGKWLGDYIGGWAQYLGAIVLFVIGIYYMYAWIKHKREQHALAQKNAQTGLRDSEQLDACPIDVSLIEKPITIITLAASVSIDALAVGFGLGVLGAEAIVTALIFGVVSGLFTYAGLTFGSKLRRWTGDKAELIGGMLLVVLAIYFIY